MSKKRHKKSQIAGQVFIYILSAMIFALVIIYGYKAIADFIGRADQVAEIELSTELKSAVSAISSSQDVKQKSLSIPSKFKKICFVDLDYSDPAASGICTNGHVDYNVIICNFWKAGAEHNVFLLPKPADVKIYVGKIDVGSNGYRCMGISNGRVKLRLEGKGDRTVISSWEET